MSPKIQICVFIIMAATTVVLAGSLSPRGSAKQPRNRYIALANRRFFQEETGEETGLQDAIKRTDAELVISGAALVQATLTAALTTIQSVVRMVAIGIDNESGNKWTALNVYFFSGTSEKTIPYEIKHGEALVYPARKTAGPVATGVVGVVAYYIKDLDRTLAVMFSVPYDYNLYQNWWNIKLYTGRVTANYSHYKDLYYNSGPFKGNNDSHDKDLGSGLHARGSMSSSGKASIMIKITKNA